MAKADIDQYLDDHHDEILYFPHTALHKAYIEGLAELEKRHKKKMERLGGEIVSDLGNNRMGEISNTSQTSLWCRLFDRDTVIY